MKHTGNIRIRALLWATLGIACLASAPPVAFGGYVGETMCACPGRSKPLGNNRTCEDACYGTRSSPGIDYGAARRAQEAAEAAAAERQRQQDEADRIERERVAEEKRKNDEFIRNRDATVLKGSTGTNTTQLKGISGTDNYGLKGSGTDAGAQLKSVERSSRDTLTSPVAEKIFMTPGKADKKMAGDGFDTPGKANGNLVYPDKKQRQIPPSALDKRVPPEAQKNPQIQQSLAWYRKLDAQKAEKEKMIAEIKEQQKTSKDPVLETKIETLKYEVKRATDDQAKVTETVQKQVKNLGFNLVESTEPTTTEANKK